MVDEQKILDKLKDWTGPLDEILEYDGTPLWVYFRQMFLTNNFPNRFFKYSIKNLKENMEKKKIKHKNAVSFLIRKAIKHNEKIKRNTRRKKKIEKKDTEKILYYTQEDKVKDKKIKKIGNLVEETIKENLADVYILSYEPIEKNSKSEILNQEHMDYDYMDKEIIKKAENAAAELNSEWKKISESKKETLLEIDEQSLYPYIKTELDYLFSKEFLEILIQKYESHKKLLKEENIKLICTIGVGSFYAKTLFAAAMKLKIPTFILQHGICFGYTEIEILKKTIFAVFGENSRKELEEDGINPKNTYITGASIFDDIIPYLNKEKPKENIIAMLTDGFYIYGLVDEKKYFNQIRKWLNEINKLENTKVVIKTHPEEKEHLEKYKEVIKEFKNVELIGTPGKDILYAQINKAKLVINFGSTVALEAMILNKPVITITNFHNSKIVEFDKVIQRIKNSGASINLGIEDDISISIKKILEDKDLQNSLKIKREQFVKDSCYIIDGNSSKRAAKVLKFMLQKNSQKI